MQKTVLNSAHRDLGARLVEFGGFEMPVWYAGLSEEHHCVRKEAGAFDLCHMGRFEITGENAVAAIDRVVTRNVAAMKTGQVCYTLVCREDGGVLDDILVYRLEDRLWLVVNAGNRAKLIPWFEEHLVGEGASLEDMSESLAMIALQGPLAGELLAARVQRRGERPLGKLGYYRIDRAEISVGGEAVSGWISRTGYTGEDGFELYLPADSAAAAFDGLLHLDPRVRPCGLGCRDTLRLEAGMPLYGHELSEEINPLEAGLAFAVSLDKANGFIGCAALTRVAQTGPRRTLGGFVVDGRRPARQGALVFSGDDQVGEVTSGSPSPTLGINIANALIDTSVSADATLEVDIRGKRSALQRHSLPYYRRSGS